MKFLKKLWNNFCWHEWWIIYEGGHGMFVEIECRKCKRREHRGMAG